MPRRADGRLTLTEAAVLALLRIEGAHSGYDLLKLAEKSIGHLWAPARSQLYATLARLVRRSLVEGEDVVQQRRPDKRVFRLTDGGIDALDTWLRDPADDSTSGFVLRVFVGGLMPPELLAAHVARYRERTAARIEELEALAAANTRRGHDWFHHLTLRLALPSERVRVEWADEVLSELEQRSRRDG